MGARIHGQGEGGTGGTCPHPWKCRKVFCALAVTIERSVDHLPMHYFQHFSSAPHSFCWAGEIWRVGVVHLVVLAYVLRATTKKIVDFFRKKVHPRENSGYA